MDEINQEQHDKKVKIIEIVKLNHCYLINILKDIS